MKKPVALVLFAGGGGSTLGLRQAGYDTLSVEIRPHAIETLGLNGFAHYQADLSCPSEQAVLCSLLQVSYPSGIDLVQISHPCQKYSTANTTNREAAVDGWPWALAILDQLRLQQSPPPDVLVENVPGAPFGQYIADLAERGWYSRVKEANMAEWGLPQRRVRRLLMATTHNGLPTFPPATHGPGTDSPFESMGEALPWLAECRAWVRQAQRGSKAYHHTDPISTVTTKGSHILYYRDPGVYPNRKEYRGVTVHPHSGGDKPELLDRPSPTVMTTEVKGTRAHAPKWSYNGGPDRAADAAFSAAHVRRLPVESCAILQGFPPEYVFAGNSTEQYQQVGNAFPPPIAKLLGERLLVARREHALAGAAVGGPTTSDDP